MNNTIYEKKEDKTVIRQFRDLSSNWWVDNCHYSLNEDNSICFCAGGQDTEERRNAILSFIRRNKKKYVARKQSEVGKEYLEVINFGKYANKSVEEILHLDSKYLQWMHKEYSFSSSQEKLKQEIKEILGKKLNI